ncbi:MAG: ATP-binding protein [Phycisphaerae bacterium]|nr:ATP-binding protein [Phycisphaerae bacterium]
MKEKQARQWDKLCPPLYQVTDVARLPQKQYAEIMEWGYDSCGLMLIGATGKGKTRCLYELLRRLFLDDGFEVIVFNCVDFGHECVRQFMSSDPDGVTDWLTRLATVDILVLDDLGKAKFTERVESELYGLIEARTANMLPILATSNFTGDAFAAKLTEDRGMAMIRRLREFCKVVIFD